MDGGGLGDLQEIIGELGRRRTLNQVAVGRAQVTRKVVGVTGQCQVGGGVRRRDDHEAGLREQRDSDARRAGARGADHGHEGRISRQLGAGCLTTLGRAAIILAGQLDVVTE